MDRKCHIIILLLLARFAFCSNCDCKLVEILRNIVQKEIMEREILESRVDMLESKFASGNIIDVSTSESSSDKTILERLSVIETMIEKCNTISKENSIERQNGARHNAAFTAAWKIHKRDFTLIKEDIHNSLSDNKKSVYDMIREADERVEVIEVKVDQLLNQTSSKVTKQLNTAEDRFEMIQSRLNLTFESYTTRMNNDFAEFKNNTDQRLHGFHTEIMNDECASNPCLNGATCLDGVRRYSCICMDGYNGINCQTEIDECSSNPCKHGATCIDALDNYSCSCVAGYSGINCQIVHGGWSLWSEWGTCSVTCDIGMQRRDRACNNPYPSRYGDHCFGDSRDDRINGKWSDWGAWSNCSDSCRGGVKSRERSCTSPRPSFTGHFCDGKPFEILPCNRSQCPDERVSFTATRISVTGKNLIFPNVIHNFGNGYDKTTGRFTCANPGTYSMSATLSKTYNSDTDYVQCKILINNLGQVGSIQDPKHFFGSGHNNDLGSYSISMSGIFHLNVNDSVNIGDCYGQETLRNDLYSSFTGFLVTPDIISK